MVYTMKMTIIKNIIQIALKMEVKGKFKSNNITIHVFKSQNTWRKGMLEARSIPLPL